MMAVRLEDLETRVLLVPQVTELVERGMLSLRSMTSLRRNFQLQVLLLRYSGL